MSHFSAETLTDYFEMRLPEGDELALEEHLADCSPCTVLAQNVRTYSSLLDTWTAEAHGEAYLNAAMGRALVEAQARVANPAWQARLASWAERWAGAAEAAVRVVMEAPGQASRVVTEGLEGLARPGAAWQFSLAPAAVPTRGTRGRGAVPPQHTVALATAAGRTQARVAVSGERGEVVVRVDELPAGQTAPLVLLVPIGEGGEPRVAAPERQPGVEYLIARFGDVPAGEYVVAFEPME